MHYNSCIASLGFNKPTLSLCEMHFQYLFRTQLDIVMFSGICCSSQVLSASQRYCPWPALCVCIVLSHTVRWLFCSPVSLLTCSSACSWDPLPMHLVGGQQPAQFRATDSWARWFPSESFIWKAHGTSVLLEAFSWHGALYSLSASATEETNC